MPRIRKDIDGILLLDKPLGLSSNAALQRVKYIFQARKAGHSGSLDPLATGMLPICFGKSTKLAARFLDARKCYRFTLRLGARTSTGDTEGDIVQEAPVPTLSREHIQSVLRRFVGSQQQIPPMYSALKHQGQRLYALARQGIEVERHPRSIEIDTLEWEEGAAPDLTLRAVVSKGTYIRVLAEDIATALGSCGHVTFLRRLWSEPFQQHSMVTLATLEATSSEESLTHYLLPPEIASTLPGSA